MKHQRSLKSIAMATIMLVSLCAVCVSSTSVGAAGGSNRATVQPSASDPVIAGMIGAMNKANIYSTTDALQRISTREYGTAGNGEAAGYLYSKLSGIPGLTVAYQGGSYKNIIATLPGTDTSSMDMVMVGAHYDSISSDPAKAPGATDNACGVAIVLELARVMSQHQFNHTIAFALWNAEEQGALGSKAYAEYAATSSLKIPLYVNYDSSCYDPDGRFILDIIYDSQSSWAKEMMTQDNTLYGIGFTLTYNAHDCGSDTSSFWERGYPAVFTHEESHGPAHTPSDTIDKVSTAYALKNGQLGMAVLAQVAEVGGSGSWGPWTSLGGQLLAGTGPAAYSWGTSRTGWFVIGTDNKLYHSWTGHTGWENLGGYLTSSPAAVSWANGRIDVFARGSNGALYHKYYQSGWSGWESIGGQLASNTGPAVSSWAVGRLDVFLVGTNNALYHKFYQGGWSGWENLGGYLTSSPGAVSRQSGVIDVFVRGTAGAVYEKTYNGGWHDWTNLGGQVAPNTGPAASGWTDHEGLFAQGTNGALYQRTRTAATGWDTWTSLGGQLTSSPSATSPGTDQIAVLGRGTNGALYERTYS